MNDSMQSKTVDSVQQRLTDYAFGLGYSDLTPEAVHAAKVRIIDTLGALIGGFFGAPCRIVRGLAAQMTDPAGATVIGTRMKTTPDMAAFVNGTTARYPEFIDSYHGPGSAHGHVSEVIAPVLAAAECAHVDGRDFITGVIIAYEIFIRISDVFHNSHAFNSTILASIGSAAAAGRLFGLNHEQIAHAISMAVVPNNILHQVGRDYKTMFKSVASGCSARAGVFAAMLARAGMEGPHLPFEGKAGWCEHVARERFSIKQMGGQGAPFKIPETQIKTRPAAGGIVGCILAAEKIAPLDLNNIEKVTVEVSRHAKRQGGTGDYAWKPDSLETADHSIPYAVAWTLKEVTFTLRSYGDSYLSNHEVRDFLRRIEVDENEEFTRAMEKESVEHRVRITVITRRGEHLVGESGGDRNDLAAPKSDTEIEEKFLGLTSDYLGARRARSIIDRLWRLEDCASVSELPPAFILV